MLHAPRPHQRPITVELGTNTVLGLVPERILEIPRLLREADERPTRVPPLWDGASAGRVVDVLLRFLDAGRAVRTRQ